MKISLMASFFTVFYLVLDYSEYASWQPPMYAKMVKVISTVLVLSSCKSVVDITSRLGLSSKVLSEMTGQVFMQIFLSISARGFIVNFFGILFSDFPVSYKNLVLALEEFIRSLLQFDLHVPEAQVGVFPLPASNYRADTMSISKTLFQRVLHANDNVFFAAWKRICQSAFWEPLGTGPGWALSRMPRSATA